MPDAVQPSQAALPWGARDFNEQVGRNRRRLALNAAVLLAVVAGVGAVTLQAEAAPKPQYFIDESKLPFDALAGVPTDRYWGVHSGAGYRIEVPQNWNGRLVLWAH